jgi:VWFA-related protein
MSLREQLIAYLKTMTPGASIAIFQLDTQMRLIQGFSSDQEALLAAAKSKRDMPSLRQPIRGSEEEYRRAKREILREGMQSLGRYLAAYPGRKNLVWFTGEVPLTIFGAGLGNPFRDKFRVGGGSSDDFSDVADALTLSRVAVYPIDTRGLQTSPQYDVSEKRPPANGTMHFEARQAFDHMDLDEVASATGGKAYYNTNGLKETLARIVERELLPAARSARCPERPGRRHRDSRGPGAAGRCRTGSGDALVPRLDDFALVSKYAGCPRSRL